MFSHLPLILDGATGTQLQKLGMPAGSCTETWVLENPEKFVAMQRAYVDAGSGIVYAPTFGANSVNLSHHGVEADIGDMVSRLVALSREAADGRALVAGDISSTGEILVPYGDTEEDELLAVFTEQAQALENAGVDLFAVETQMYLDEARLAVKAVRAVSQKPLMVSFSCGATGRTIWGEELCDVCRQLEAEGINAFGINCCGDLELVVQLVAQLREATALPIIAKPNAGVPVTRDGRSVYELLPETMAEYALRFRQAGAGLIGGCCGTDERHIAAIKAALN